MHAFIRASTSAGTGRRGENPANGGQPHSVCFTVLADTIPDCRRTERLRDLPVADGLDDFLRINQGRAGRVHVGNHRGRAHRSVEQSEEGKGRKVDLTRLNPIKIADFLDLGIEIAMGEEHAFGRTCAAGGEDDGRRIVSPRCRRFQLESGAAPSRANWPPARSSASVTPPQNHRRPTVA